MNRRRRESRRTSRKRRCGDSLGARTAGSLTPPPRYCRRDCFFLSQRGQRQDTLFRGRKYKCHREARVHFSSSWVARTMNCAAHVSNAPHLLRPPLASCSAWVAFVPVLCGDCARRGGLGSHFEWAMGGGIAICFGEGLARYPVCRNRFGLIFSFSHRFLWSTWLWCPDISYNVLLTSFEWYKMSNSGDYGRTDKVCEVTI